MMRCSMACLSLSRASSFYLWDIKFIFERKGFVDGAEREAINASVSEEE